MAARGFTMVIALLVGCVGEPPPAKDASSRSEPALVAEPVTEPPASRTVPLHYETRRIGPSAGESSRSR